MTINFSSAKPHLSPIEVSETQAQAKTLMTLLLEAKIPVASSCQGDGICSKCRIHIMQGHDNLSLENDLEIITKKKNNVTRADRLSCQTYLLGNVTIDTNYW